jgi:hypothetical protein
MVNPTGIFASHSNLLINNQIHLRNWCHLVIYAALMRESSTVAFHIIPKENSPETQDLKELNLFKTL